MIDSHAHINDVSFSDDLEGVIRRARDAGISCILDIGEGIESSRKSAGIAEKHDLVFSAAGIHPHHAESGGSLLEIEKLLSHEKVVAVGEIGLDYYRGQAESGAQRRLFEKSLEIACRRGLPVIIHCRQAFEDVRRIIGRFAGIRGVMHCFSGGAAEAERFLELGLYISFAGNFTFPKATALREAASFVPLDRMLLETDCPYPAPQAVRGKRNEPAYVRYIYEFIAELRSTSPGELDSRLSANFSDLFGVEIRRDKKK